MLKLIFLYGPPAAGKFTIASELSKRTGISLFHNHDVVDVVGKIFPFGSKEFIRLRENYWLSMFKEAASADKSLIFTFNPERTVRPSLIDDIQQPVHDAGGVCIFIAITCSERTTLNRIDEPSRQAFGKLTDPELYTSLSQQGAFEFDYTFNPKLIINTDSVKPKEACQLIIRELAQYR